MQKYMGKIVEEYMGIYIPKTLTHVQALPHRFSICIIFYIVFYILYFMHRYFYKLHSTNKFL